MADTDSIRAFFDREACCGAGRAGEAGMSAASRMLLALVADTVPATASVLDVGCGQGAMAVALARRGHPRVDGLDLSPASIAEARRAAGAAGVTVGFGVADAATATLEPHDLVVANKVVCCYAGAEALLGNVAAASRSGVALALPHARGLRGLLARLAIGAENLIRRVRGDAFRAYVHDEAAVDGPLLARGFRPVAERSHRTWRAVVYERRGPG